MQLKQRLEIKKLAKAEKNAEEKILDILVSKTSSESTRDSFRQKLRSGELNDKEVEIPVAANSSMSLPTMDIPGMPGSQMGMINLGDMFGKNFGKQKKMKKMTVSESHYYLLQEETEKLLDQDKINSRALEDVKYSKSEVRIKWYEDGTLNASANCIDRHLKNKKIRHRY